MPAATAPTRSPWLRQLPPTVAAEVRRRRGELLSNTRGRVLDLDAPEFAGLLDRTSPPAALDDEPYDTIISTCRLIAAPDLLATLSALSDRLAVDGDLYVVEPVGHPGAVGLLTASLGSWLPGMAGLHLGRDVPATVRATGLTVVDLERFTVPTAMSPLRRFVQLRATRLSSVPARGDGPTTGVVT